MFALALELPPAAFGEFGAQPSPRWEAKALREMEDRTWALFFDTMMAAYGYTPHPLPLEVLDEARVLAFFVAKAAFPADLDRILHRMGELSMGFRELEKVSGVEAARLRALFTDPAALEQGAPALLQTKRALHMA